MEIGKNYTQSIVIFLLGLGFLVFPWLAAFLLGGGLIFLSIIYALLTHKWNKMSTQSYRPRNAFEEEVFSHGSPNFRNIFITVQRRYY